MYIWPLLKFIYNITKLSNELFFLILLIDYGLHSLKYYLYNYKETKDIFFQIKNDAIEYIQEKIEILKNTYLYDKISFICYVILFIIDINIIYIMLQLFYPVLKFILTYTIILAIIIEILAINREILIYLINNYKEIINNMVEIIGCFIEEFLKNIQISSISINLNFKNLIIYIFINCLEIICIYFIFAYMIFPCIIFGVNLIVLLIHIFFILGLIIFIFLYYIFNYKIINPIINSIIDTIIIYIDKKKEKLKDVILKLLDFKLSMAKKVVASFLSEDVYKYKKFANDINNFGRKDFFKLFFGELNIDDDNEEIEALCNKYNICEIKDFRYLALKFINFQIIITEWYEDKTKHEYLKNLWLLYPTIYKLNDLNEKELEEKLLSINYSKWKENDKKEFKQMIANSPEIKALEISNFIKNNFQEFNLLLDNITNFNYNITKKDYDMKIYNNKFNYYIKKIVKKVLDKKEIYTGYISKIKNILENRTLDCLFKKYIEKENSNYNYDFYFNKFINIIKNEKIKNFIKSSNKIMSNINIIFSFIELSYEVIDLAASFKELRNTDCLIFSYELRMINIDFINHKNRIKYISGNDEKDKKLIESILIEMEQDRNNIIELINSIENKEKREKLEKKYNTITLMKDGLIVIGSTLGAIFSGGATSIVGSIISLIGFVRTANDTLKVVINIKNINSFRELLEIANKKKFEIEQKIEEIRLIYFKRLSNHCPKEIKEKVLEYYSNKENKEEFY